MKSLSVCIVAHGEREDLRECLEGIRWADEIVLVDTGDDDGILGVARDYTDRVFRAENTLNPNENKNYAFSKATCEWILSLDPDEVVSAQLREEIRELLDSGKELVSAYFIPRRNYYFGRWLKRGGFYPDRQLRLFRRGEGYFPCRHIHEKLAVVGKRGSLRGPLIHNTYRTMDQYFEKLEYKADFEALFMKERGIEPGFLAAVKWVLIVPFTRFFRRYVLKGGFLDGWTGFVACALDWVNYLVRYEKLVEINRSHGGTTAERE